MDEILKCHICNKGDDKGIILLNKYICRECESDLTYLNPEELKYEIIKRGIRDIWKGVFIQIINNGIS